MTIGITGWMLLRDNAEFRNRMLEVSERKRLYQRIMQILLRTSYLSLHTCISYLSLNFIHEIDCSLFKAGATA